MGKKLIIKGANFAPNAIGDVTVPKLTELLTPLVIGVQWYILQIQSHPKNPPSRNDAINNARASTTTLIDISSWAQYIGTVHLTPKAGYKIAAYFGNNNPDDNLINWDYTDSGNTLTVNVSSVTYALIMVASNDNSELTSTDWNTYITET